MDSAQKYKDTMTVDPDHYDRNLLDPYKHAGASVLYDFDWGDNMRTVNHIEYTDKMDLLVEFLEEVQGDKDADFDDIAAVQEHVHQELKCQPGYQWFDVTGLPDNFFFSHNNGLIGAGAWYFYNLTARYKLDHIYYQKAHQRIVVISDSYKKTSACMEELIGRIYALCSGGGFDDYTYTTSRFDKFERSYPFMTEMEYMFKSGDETAILNWYIDHYFNC